MGSEGKADFLMAPVSSPDGKQIAALLAHTDDLRVKRISLSGLDGTESTRLVDADVHTQPQFALRWSPDGKSLWYSAVRDKRYHVFVVNVSDRKPIQVTSGDYDDIEPDVYGGEQAQR